MRNMTAANAIGNSLPALDRSSTGSIAIVAQEDHRRGQELLYHLVIRMCRCGTKGHYVDQVTRFLPTKQHVEFTFDD